MKLVNLLLLISVKPFNDAALILLTLVAIEQGQRRIRTDELQVLARLYKTSANALMREEAVHVDLAPRFRKMSEARSDGIEEAVTLLDDLARAEVELENILGIKKLFNYPPERPILSGDVRAQAEQDATELRQRLGLGLAPIRDMVTCSRWISASAPSCAASTGASRASLPMTRHSAPASSSTPIIRCRVATRPQGMRPGISLGRGTVPRCSFCTRPSTPVKSDTPTPSREHC